MCQLWNVPKVTNFGESMTTILFVWTIGGAAQTLNMPTGAHLGVCIHRSMREGCESISGQTRPIPLRVEVLK